MKNFINQILLAILFSLAIIVTNTYESSAQQQLVQGKLEYMMKESQEKVFEIAQTENKPVLIYIHSQTCLSSKKFSREIMNHVKVKGMIRNRYICMNGDVSTKYGKQMAAKHGVLIMPALYLFSPDKSIMFQCKLEVDTFEMLSQFRSFISACNIVDQVKFQQKTSSLSEKEIIRQIGRSYAIKDFKTNNAGEIAQRVSIRTLNINFLKEFEVGYREEWKVLLASSNGKNIKSETDNIK